MSIDREHAARAAPVASGPRKRTLLLGGCQVASLGKELINECENVQLWRAPTVALMSEPILPATSLGFDDRHARYILDDCGKAHLARLQAAQFDILIFEIVRDVRCPLVRGGNTYLFDPNRMYCRVADAPPPAERTIDVAAFLGLAATGTLEAPDPRFFNVWAEHFDRFYDVVLAPRIDADCIVILQQIYMAKQTEPPSDLFRHLWGYCDALNALLRRMYAHVASYHGIRLVGVDEAHCVTADDAPFGGPYIAHPVQAVFERLADQARAVIAPERVSHPEGPAAPWFRQRVCRQGLAS